MSLFLTEHGNDEVWPRVEVTKTTAIEENVSCKLDSMIMCGVFPDLTVTRGNADKSLSAVPHLPKW